MIANSIDAKGLEGLSGHPEDATAAAKAVKKSWLTRIFDRMAANAQRQALSRLSAIDPRLASELRAAQDRNEAQAQI